MNVKYTLLVVLFLAFGASADNFFDRYDRFSANTYQPGQVLTPSELRSADPFADIPYSTNTPKLYDSLGNYRGELSTNPYALDSISNEYGQYGSKYSPDSVNNPYGAGSPYKLDSPNNPYGTGYSVDYDDGY